MLKGFDGTPKRKWSFVNPGCGIANAHGEVCQREGKGVGLKYNKEAATQDDQTARCAIIGNVIPRPLTRNERHELVRHCIPHGNGLPWNSDKTPAISLRLSNLGLWRADCADDRLNRNRSFCS